MRERGQGMDGARKSSRNKTPKGTPQKAQNLKGDQHTDSLVVEERKTERKEMDERRSKRAEDILLKTLGIRQTKANKAMLRYC